MCQSRQIDKQTVEVQNLLCWEQSGIQLSFSALGILEKWKESVCMCVYVFTGDVLMNGSAGNNKTKI